MSRKETEGIFRQQQHWQAKKQGKQKSMASVQSKIKRRRFLHGLILSSVSPALRTMSCLVLRSVQLSSWLAWERKDFASCVCDCTGSIQRASISVPEACWWGWIELFCVSDGGGKYLEVIIKASEGGHTVEYSQRQNMHLSIAEGDLDVSPCSTDVEQVACHVM